jgi:glycosyltransferase involved in cell wall biosynthesis
MKTACLTVIYPGVEDFIEEYLQCIQRQTFKDFDLVVINDHFPLSIEQILKRINIKVEVFDCFQTPQGNRLHGLKMCRELGYDLVVCSDADDVMFDDRIERIVAYFLKNEDKKIVYNNLVNDRFDLFYKDCITLYDILEFNVLGYGASSVRGDLIPFILEHSNENVPILDWWIALVYLLHFKKVDFLRDVKSYYRMHPDNYVGPVFNITEEKLKHSLYVKKIIYLELAEYCQRNTFSEEEIFVQKYKEIDEIECFINEYSFSSYYEQVKAYFSDVPKLFWWQDVISLNNCNKIKS